MMATVSGQSKKKPTHHADLRLRDGHSGMSSHTKRHFASVQQKLVDYMAHQQGYEYDGIVLEPHHHHHHHYEIDDVFVDGKKAPKTPTHTQTSSSSASTRKQLSHSGIASSQVHHHGGKHSTSSSRK